MLKTHQERAQHWLAQDPDEDTRAELQKLLSDDNALGERFAGPLEFGTAGLRGLIGAGETRMNIAVVVTTTAALCDVLEEKVENAHARGMVIGFDARRGSRQMAHAAAQIAASRGFSVWLFDDYAPTPLVAFSLQQQKAAAAIVVTASHNPPDYNGYKVYWENGAQIIPPVNEWVRLAAEKRAAQGAKTLLDAAQKTPGTIQAAPDSWRDAYTSAILSVRRHAEISLADLRIAYTPLHGVGAAALERAFTAAGVTSLFIVPSQHQPDGAFPTVKFPNPEESGAMDALLTLAHEKHADVAIANDPDADRFAVSVREDDHYRTLSGNEIGTLLAAYVLAQHKGQAPLVATTVVSSPELSVLAKAHGAHYAETLTGFKWIANTGLQRTRGNDTPFLFGYEEALGYTVDTHVRDKDGISAAMLFVDLFAWLRAKGLSVRDFQLQTAQQTGAFSSLQKSLTFSGDVKGEIARRMHKLRQSPPLSIADDKIVATRDFAVAENNLPTTDLLAFTLASGSRVLVRPSGTEPKIKFYADVRQPLAPGATTKTLSDLQKQGVLRAEALIEDLVIYAQS